MPFVLIILSTYFTTLRKLKSFEPIHLWKVLESLILIIQEFHIHLVLYASTMPSPIYVSFSLICPLYICCYCPGSFLHSIPFRKPLASESLVIGSLRISVATLLIISYKLNTPFVYHLLYISLSISVSVSWFCILNCVLYSGWFRCDD